MFYRVCLEGRKSQLLSPRWALSHYTDLENQGHYGCVWLEDTEGVRLSEQDLAYLKRATKWW